eukprot:jgi/Ulvmu1/5149/UM021_0166.1
MHAEANMSQLGGGSSFSTTFGPEHSAIAVVLDAEATSYLMMGSLSPGMKRHSVTLFEGGRLAGQQAIEDMRQELWSSVQAVASFGAEMEGLPGTLESLATIVDTLCEAGQPLEIIRKESLSALAVRAASRMLQMAYSAIIAIEPLRLPALPLPVSHGRGPAFFGAVAPMLTPWLTLALLSELKTGPVSLGFTHGQRVTAMPPMAHGCTHAFLWPWEPEKWPGKDMGQLHVPHLVDSKFLLYILNGLLSCTAVLLQPLWLSSSDSGKPAQSPAIAAAARSSRNAPTKTSTQCEGEAPVKVALVGLPLYVEEGVGRPGVTTCHGLWNESNEEAQIPVPGRLLETLRTMGLDKAMGYLWMVPQNVCTNRTNSSGSAADVYVPYKLSLGLPLYNSTLCKMICRELRKAQLLTKEGIENQSACQVKSLHVMAALISTCTSAQSTTPGHTAPFVTAESLERQQFMLPTQRLIFDGSGISCIDGTSFCQGTAVQSRLL